MADESSNKWAAVPFSETRQFSEVLRDVEEKFSKLQECAMVLDQVLAAPLSSQSVRDMMSQVHTGMGQMFTDCTELLRELHAAYTEASENEQADHYDSLSSMYNEFTNVKAIMATYEIKVKDALEGKSSERSRHDIVKDFRDERDESSRRHERDDPYHRERYESDRSREKYDRDRARDDYHRGGHRSSDDYRSSRHHDPHDRYDRRDGHHSKSSHHDSRDSRSKDDHRREDSSSRHRDKVPEGDSNKPHRQDDNDHHMKRHSNSQDAEEPKRPRLDQHEELSNALVPVPLGESRWDTLISDSIKVIWLSTTFHQDYEAITVDERPCPTPCYDFTLWLEKKVELREQNYRCIACQKVHANPQELQLHWMDVHEKYRLRRKCPLCGINVCFLMSAVVYHLSTHSSNDIDQMGLKNVKASMIKNDMFPLTRELSSDYKPVKRRPALAEQRELQTKTRSQFLDPQFKISNLCYSLMANEIPTYAPSFMDVQIIGGFKQKLCHQNDVDEFDLDQINGRRWIQSAKGKKKDVPKVKENAAESNKKEAKKDEKKSGQTGVAPIRTTAETRELQSMIQRKIELMRQQELEKKMNSAASTLITEERLKTMAKSTPEQPTAEAVTPTVAIVPKPTGPPPPFPGVMPSAGMVHHEGPPRMVPPGNLGTVPPGAPAMIPPRAPAVMPSGQVQLPVRPHNNWVSNPPPPLRPPGASVNFGPPPQGPFPRPPPQFGGPPPMRPRGPIVRSRMRPPQITAGINVLSLLPGYEVPDRWGAPLDVGLLVPGLNKMFKQDYMAVRTEPGVPTPIYDFTPWQIRDSNPIQYLCLVCGYHFVSKSQGEMQVHWQERHEKFVLKRKCTICGRTTSTSTKAFVDHLIQCHRAELPYHPREHLIRNSVCQLVREPSYGFIATHHSHRPPILKDGDAQIQHSHRWLLSSGLMIETDGTYNMETENEGVPSEILSVLHGGFIPSSKPEVDAAVEPAPQSLDEVPERDPNLGPVFGKGLKESDLVSTSNPMDRWGASLLMGAIIPEIDVPFFQDHVISDEKSAACYPTPRYDFNLWRLSSINRYVCLLCDNAKPGFDSKLKMQAHWEVKHEKYTMYRVCCICGVKQGAKSFIRHLKTDHTHMEVNSMGLEFLNQIHDITNAMIPIVRMKNMLYIPGKVTHRPPVLDNGSYQKDWRVMHLTPNYRISDIPAKLESYYIEHKVEVIEPKIEDDPEPGPPMAVGIKVDDLVPAPSVESRWGVSVNDEVIIPGDELPFKQDRVFDPKDERMEVIATPRYDFSLWRLKADPLNYLCLICGQKPFSAETELQHHYQELHEVFIQQRKCTLCNQLIGLKLDEVHAHMHSHGEETLKAHDIVDSQYLNCHAPVLRTRSQKYHRLQSTCRPPVHPDDEYQSNTQNAYCNPEESINEIVTLHEQYDQSTKEELQRLNDASIVERQRKEAGDLIHSNVDASDLPNVVLVLDRWGTLTSKTVTVPGFSKPFHDDFIESMIHICIPSPAYDFTLWYNTKEKLYVCLICGENIGKKQHLMQLHYLQTHEKFLLNRKCPICNIHMAFNPDTVVEHLKTHTRQQLINAEIGELTPEALTNKMLKLVRRKNVNYSQAEVTRRPPILCDDKFQRHIRNSWTHPQKPLGDLMTLYYPGEEPTGVVSKPMIQPIITPRIPSLMHVAPSVPPSVPPALPESQNTLKVYTEKELQPTVTKLKVSESELVGYAPSCWGSHISRPVQLPASNTKFIQDYMYHGGKVQPTPRYDFSHWRKSANPQKVVCLVCDTSYKSEKSLYIHWNAVHTMFPLFRKCSLCEDIIRGAWLAVKEHMEVKHAERTKEPITNAVMPLYREYNPKHRAYVKRPALMTDKELQNKHHSNLLNSSGLVRDFWTLDLSNGEKYDELDE